MVATKRVSGIRSLRTSLETLAKEHEVTSRPDLKIGPQPHMGTSPEEVEEREEKQEEERMEEEEDAQQRVPLQLIRMILEPRNLEA